MYYKVNGYRFITKKMDPAKTCVLQVLTVALPNYAKINLKNEQG